MKKFLKQQQAAYIMLQY